MLKPIVRAHPGLVVVTGLAVSGLVVAACEVPTPPEEDRASSYSFETAESGLTKQELATAHAELGDLQRGIEGLIARGAGDPLSELHGELEALQRRARQTQTRIERISRGQSGAVGVIEEKRGGTFRAEQEGRRVAELRAQAERQMTAERALGSVMRLRELDPERHRAESRESRVLRFGTDLLPAIYVDDVQVTNIDNLSPDRIERIEVRKTGGPGTIRIYTKRQSN